MKASPAITAHVGVDFSPDITPETSQRSDELCKYKPVTLKDIRNRQGRILVKRHGFQRIRGTILVCILILTGDITGWQNWPSRDNWLERLFDGADVLSMLTSLLAPVIYVMNGMLKSTFDWLVGVTEVQNDMDLVSSLHVTTDEVKVATTFEKVILFWLSDLNSSFCSATTYRELIFE